MTRTSPDGNCVVEAINRQVDILASKASDEKRLTALKFVVQLVADVHQPLHAGYAEDRGGNTYQNSIETKRRNAIVFRMGYDVSLSFCI